MIFLPKKKFSLIKKFENQFLPEIIEFDSLEPCIFNSEFFKENKKLNNVKKFIVNETFQKKLLSDVTDRRFLNKDKEIMIVGQKNSGKTTLVNKIFGINDKRQTKNFVQRYINYSQSIIDTPGYAQYKKRSFYYKQNQETFKYIACSPKLIKLVWVLNLKLGITKSDFEFFDRIQYHKVPIQLSFSQVDQIDAQNVFNKACGIIQQFRKYNQFEPYVYLTSGKLGLQKDIISDLIRLKVLYQKDLIFKSRGIQGKYRNLQYILDQREKFSTK